MFLNSLNFFKLLYFLFFITYGIFLISQGFLSLEKKIVINKDKINDTSPEIQSNDQSLKVEEKKELFENNKLVLKKSYKEKIITVKKNDTFSKIIDPFFTKKIKIEIITKLNEKLDLNYLSIGQKIYLYENKESLIEKIVLPKNLDTDLVIYIDSDKVSVNIEKVKIIKEINALEFYISTSLYEDGINAGVPLSILSDSIRLYSFDIDFQRDIKKNTKFEVLYETLINSKRNNIEYGNIQYINLKIEKKDLEYFIFETEEGYFDYFNREGKNIKKSLLKTPIDGARLSSSFGMRKHPISGFNKLHKGVDFAAPKGTPIYAGGNGVVEYIGRNGNYGKYIRLRHNNEYKTAYAHLSGYKKGLSLGSRVNQGDIIGYVGSTGNSTGPHLHYEIIYQNKQINPMKLKLPSGKILSGDELEKFKKISKSIYAKHLFALYE